MDNATAQVLAQARVLRQLCGDNAHGAARDAFLARLDDDIDSLYAENVRITVIPLGSPDAITLSRLTAGLANEDVANETLSKTGLLVIGDTTDQRQRSDDRCPAAFVPLSHDATNQGLRSVKVVLSGRDVFSSPLLFGRIIQETDLALFVGVAASQDEVILAGIRRLSEQCRFAIHDPNGAAPGTAEAIIKVLFRDWLALPAETAGATLLERVWQAVTPDRRREMVGHGVLTRLGLHADLLLKHIQSEVADLKFRQGEIIRIRRGEDIADGSADLREQADALKATLEQWITERKEAMALANADGLLPFDPRLLANRVDVHDLIHREEKSVAVIKYPILNSRPFHPLVSHHFTLLPDPAAITQIHSRLVSAIDSQVRTDSESLAQHAGDLADGMRRNGELYPQFAAALAGVRLPQLPREKFAHAMKAVELEVEAEDHFVREGFFKRLMEGRMVASMAFSFVTMSAGVFVLFGDPSIKRGLMKFSGVIVIMMVLYFVFTLMLAGEEEKKELEEKLEKIRAQIHQAVMRPLAKVEQAVMKIYQEFVQEVKDTYLSVIETVTKMKSGEKARIAEARKAEDELQKAFLQRRQQAGVSLTQKVPQFITGLDKVRGELEKLAGGAVATAAATTARPGGAAAPAAPGAASAAQSAVAAAQERLAALRAASATSPPTAAAPKPLTLAERMAALKAKTASPAPAEVPKQPNNEVKP